MLQRLLVERIEHRIIVGTVAFLATMVLVGWIAINEGGRMAAFERQYHARSIERGAALFATNCATCHGINGYGIGGFGPALNSPYLFGHDYYGPINVERQALEAELAAGNLTEARTSEINARLAELDTEEAALLGQMQPAIDRGYDPTRPSRLESLGWPGTLNNFVYTTLVHGRPLSGTYWPNGQMVAWLQPTGPLRADQLQDLTNYILNWNKGDGWTLEDLNAVQQFPLRVVDAAQAGAIATESGPPVGTDVQAILAELPNYTGDPVNGQTIYNSKYACSGCHMNAAVAPPTEQTWAAANGERQQDPQLADYTAEQYIVESIVNPGAYTVPGYPSGVMPGNFGERISFQEMADILAYLASYDEGAQAAQPNTN